MKFETIIIGGGASALFLASNLANKNIAILEQNSSLGRKILVSGGGKCNITNEFISPQNYLGDREFTKQILSNLSYKDVLKFFNTLEFIKVKNNQFFCKTNSKDILSTLTKDIPKDKIFLNSKVLEVEKDKDIFIVKTDSQIFESKNLVVASGGLSYSKLGISDIGYKIALKFGHKVSKLNRALQI